MDQHPLTRCQPGAGFQRVDRRHEGDRHGGGLLGSQLAGQSGHGVIAHHHPAGKSAGDEAEHPVPNREAHAGAGGFHPSGGFHAQSGAGVTVHQHVFRQQALGPHHVAEIQPGGFDLDAQFALGQRHLLAGQAVPGQGAELAGLADDQAGRLLAILRREATAQARHQAGAAGQHHFAFAVRRVQHFAHQALRCQRRFQPRADIHPAQAQRRVFVRQHPRHAEAGGGGRMVRADHGLLAAFGDQHQRLRAVGTGLCQRAERGQHLRQPAIADAERGGRQHDHIAAAHLFRVGRGRVIQQVAGGAARQQRRVQRAAQRPVAADQHGWPRRGGAGGGGARRSRQAGGDDRGRQRHIWQRPQIGVLEAVAVQQRRPALGIEQGGALRTPPGRRLAADEVPHRAGGRFGQQQRAAFCQRGAQGGQHGGAKTQMRGQAHHQIGFRQFGAFQGGVPGEAAGLQRPALAVGGAVPGLPRRVHGDMQHPAATGGQGGGQVAAAAEVQHPQRPVRRPGGGEGGGGMRQFGGHATGGFRLGRQQHQFGGIRRRRACAQDGRQPVDRVGNPGKFGRQVRAVGIDHAPDFAGVGQRRVVQQAPAIGDGHRELAQRQLGQQRLGVGGAWAQHAAGLGGEGGERGGQHAAAQQLGGLVDRVTGRWQGGAQGRQQVVRRAGGGVQGWQQVEAEHR